MKLDHFYLKDTLEQKYRDNVGDFSYGEPKVIDWNDGSKLFIGKYCCLATGTTILLSGDHDHSQVSNFPFMPNPDFSDFKEYYELEYLNHHVPEYIKSKGGVTIGNDVWIGTDAMILSGSIIGDGAVIGARAVVTGEIPPYSIAVGVPAKVIGYRFEKDIIDRLLKIKWWNLPYLTIRANRRLFEQKPTHDVLDKIEKLK